MEEEDPIKKLLQQTGWSYTEVLKKLEAYKNLTSDTSDSQPEADQDQKKESSKDSNVECTSSNINKEESVNATNDEKYNIGTKCNRKKNEQSTLDLKNVMNDKEDTESRVDIKESVNSFNNKKENVSLKYGSECNVELNNKEETDNNKVDIQNLKLEEEKLEKVVEQDSDSESSREESLRKDSNENEETALENNSTQNLDNITNQSCTIPLLGETLANKPLEDLKSNSKNEAILPVNQNNCRDNQTILKNLNCEVSVKQTHMLHNVVRTKRKVRNRLNSRSIKYNVSNIRLRILRKYNNILKARMRKSEAKPKVVKTEDIHSKLKEQLELLRTKRKTSDLPLVPPKPSTIFTFSQRNVERLNSITSTLIQKLSCNNIKVVEETNDSSDLEDNCSALENEVVSNSDSAARNKEHVNANNNKSERLKRIGLEVEEYGHSQEKLEVGVILSNQSDFIISSVVGGYASPTSEHRNDSTVTEDLLDISKDESYIDVENDNYEALQSLKTASAFDKNLALNGITPTKTTDVTKIKGWKKKKFTMANKELLNKPSDKLLLQLCSDSETSNQSKPSVVDTVSEESDSSLSEKPEKSNQTQSAFISDVLDQYLTKNAQLNISYEVPKLEAEQTITTKYIDIKFPELPQKITKPSLSVTKDGYKPKTLAEKRKMLAETQKPEVKDFMISMNSKQRQDYEESVLNMRKKLIEEDVPFTRRCFMASTSITNTHSFILYNGKKLTVPSKSTKSIVTRIKERKKMYKGVPSTQHRKRYKYVATYLNKKPSLLKSLKSDITKIPYNPKEWETVQMKLPKIILEVKPQIGKCVNPKIEHLINSDGVILTQERVKFALSTLKVKNVTPRLQTFTFPLSYLDGQRNMSMQKKLAVVIDLPKVVAESPVAETDSKIDETLSDIVNKLLDYVDISEETKDIIQDEVELKNPEKTVVLPQQAEATSEKNLKRKSKVVHGPKSVHKTTLEMKRLNCKIVSISLDEECCENKLCEKEYCKLGCVCKSIECNSANLLPTHCGLAKCMFKCMCNNKQTNVGKNISLPSGTDIFSEGIINRLQDEAKKDLAKVEKEFTQTVIKTNNQIIMVGDSKERRRRATKMPKKYIDFVEEDPEPKYSRKDMTANTTYRAMTENYEDDSDIKPCYVKLLKTDFSEILPFCMVHSLYKCHCRCKAVFDCNKDDKTRAGCNYVDPTKPIPQSPSKLGLSIKSNSRLKNDKTFCKDIHSSRTRGLATSYYLIRNKSVSYRSKILRNNKKMKKDLERFLRGNAKKILTDIDETPETPVEPLQPQPQIPRKQRKQSLIVLEDPESDSLTFTTERELKLQRRKIKSNIKITRTEVVNTTKSANDSMPASLFKGTKKLKGEFLSLLGKKTSQMRLLPWATLAKQYEDGSFQLWYSNTSKACPLIITENGKRPTNHHYNIKHFERMPHESPMPSEIIRWLITKKMPEESSAENILLVLSYNKFYWEICGICEKNKTKNTKLEEKVSLSLIDSWSNSDTAAIDAVIDLDADDTNENSSDKCKNIEKKMEMLVHENMEDSKKVMYCSKRRFQQKKLISEADETNNDIVKNCEVLFVPVPGVTSTCKWRVIYMSLGFAYLSLSRSSYTIKYDDIMKAVNLAHSDRTTIVLKSEELQKNYRHRKFGIYCVHNYSDKIFVGPYFVNENHDLDTLSFVNNVLVNTSLYNQIKGKTTPGSGRWFRQATSNDEKTKDDDVVVVQDQPTVVDLTCDSDEDPLNTSQADSSTRADSFALLKHMLLTSNANEDTEKAERALDTLLKKGQLNVNKTLVQLDSLKSLIKTNSPPLQATTQVNNEASIKTNVAKNKDVNDHSELDNEDKLVTDEETGTKRNLHEQVSDSVLDNNSTSDNKKLFVDVSSVVNQVQARCTRYLITNIPSLGYILAYQYENSSIDVMCPITKSIKRFKNPEAAIASLECVLAKRFILVPATFKLKVNMLEKLENAVCSPLGRSVLDGLHAVGVFGVKNIAESTPSELKQFGFDKSNIGRLLYEQQKKLLWHPLVHLGRLLAVTVTEPGWANCLVSIVEGALKEIKTLERDNGLFIKEKIDLETQRVQLAEKCSKLLAEFPEDQRITAQQDFDRIINFSRRRSLSNTSPITSTNLSNKNVPVSENIDRASVTPSNVGSVINHESIKILCHDDPPNNIKDTQNTTSKSKFIPVTGPMKFTLSKGPSVTRSSLLPKKTVQTLSPVNPRSILNGQVKNYHSQKDHLSNKYVIVTKKRNTTTSVNPNSNIVDLTKCSLQIKSSNTNEGMLVQEVPIQLRNEMLQVANNTVLHQKPKKLLLSNAGIGGASNSSLSSKPILSKISNVNPILTATTNNCSNNATLMALPKMALSNNVVNVVQSSGSPLMRVPMSTVSTTTKSNGNVVKGSTMATLTPISVSSPPYIAIKDGNSTKYFQLLPPSLQQVQSIKRPASSVMIQPPTKKIAPATSLLMNQKTDTK